jgi:hypothetical protein
MEASRKKGSIYHRSPSLIDPGATSRPGQANTVDACRGATSATASFASTAPGAKVTVKDPGWLGATVTGNERPLTENSESLVPPKLRENTDTLAQLSVSVPV